MWGQKSVIATVAAPVVNVCQRGPPPNLLGAAPPHITVKTHIAYNVEKKFKTFCSQFNTRFLEHCYNCFREKALIMRNA